MCSGAVRWQHIAFQMPEIAVGAVAGQEVAAVGAEGWHAPADVAADVAWREDVEAAALQMAELAAVAEKGRFRPAPWKVAPTGKVAAAGSRGVDDYPVAYLYYNSFKAGLTGPRPWTAPDGGEPSG